MPSTPKVPTKDAATKRLEQEQLASLNKQKMDAGAAIYARKKRVKNKSLGRRSLLRTGERGVMPAAKEV